MFTKTFHDLVENCVLLVLLCQNKKKVGRLQVYFCFLFNIQ